MALTAGNSSGTTASKILYFSLVDQLIQRKWISAVLWENPIKYVWIIHQMYLTVYIRPSHMESSTQFITKFFFRWSTQFSAFEPPNKNPQNSCMSFQWATTLLPSPETTVGNRWAQSLITNFLSFNPPSSIATIQITTSKQDLLVTTSKISHCLLQLKIAKIIKAYIFHLRSAWTSTETSLA